MTIWLISDTHFGHENMYSFVGLDGITRVRPEFTCAKDADEYMIEQWNSRVKPQDHVYHLGDVAIRRADLQTIKKLNGHKRLVLGNHDIYLYKEYVEVGFKKLFGSRKLDKILCTHIPIHEQSIPRWAVGNVHGHIHERGNYSVRHLNVSVEQTNYAPVTLEEVQNVLQSQESKETGAQANVY